ncbi:MAG: protoporphyrinogen oxidase [Rubripirellula sp.]
MGVNAIDSRRIAVIGGGLSGLTTAAKLQLAAPQLDISLFESQPRLGGVIYTEQVDGFLIDHGADMFATKPAGVLELCEQLGISDRVIEAQQARRGARIVRSGSLVPVPDGFVLMRATQLLPILKTPLLSLSGKLRFLAERWVQGPDTDQDVSVGEFVRKRMGQEALDRLVAPLVAGIYTADVSKLSMQSTMAPLDKMVREHGSFAKATAARRKTGEDSVERLSTGARYGQFRSFRNGMFELIQGLEACLPKSSIHLQSPVESLSRLSKQWQIKAKGHDAQTFDHVVVATPPRHATNLLRDIAPTAADELAAIQAASTAIVVLGVRRADIPSDIETFGFVVPPNENRKILAGSFASHKFPDRAPEDHVLIRVFIGGALQAELLELSDQALIQLALSELKATIGLDGEPRLAKVIRWTDAMPQYHVGHADRIKRIEESIAQNPNLSLVSNVMHGVGIAPVIQLADKVASQIVASSSESDSCRN